MDVPLDPWPGQEGSPGGFGILSSSEESSYSEESDCKSEISLPILSTLCLHLVQGDKTIWQWTGKCWPVESSSLVGVDSGFMGP
jgi:hypothetical protein